MEDRLANVIGTKAMPKRVRCPTRTSRATFSFFGRSEHIILLSMRMDVFVSQGLPDLLQLEMSDEAIAVMFVLGPGAYLMREGKLGSTSPSCTCMA